MARRLSDLIARESPLSPRRAAAITLAIIDELRDPTSPTPVGHPFIADDVALHADGSVLVIPTVSTRHRTGADDGASTSATGSIARVLFEMTMARLPISPAEAHEPRMVESFGPAVCALVMRGCSDSEAQWPTLDEWHLALGPIAGSSTIDVSPLQRSRRRRARTVAGLVLILMAAITIVILLAIPRWWSGATVEGSILDHAERFESAERV